MKMKINSMLCISVLVFTFFIECASATYSTNSFVAEYNWSADSGATVLDSSGQGNHGKNTGSVLVDIGNGHKYRTFLNSSSQYISIPTSESLNATTGLTLEVWIKPSVYQDKTKNVYILNKENAYGIKIGNTAGTSTLNFILKTDAGSKSFGEAYTPIQNDNWHQIVCTYNGTSQTVKVYDDVSVFYSATGASVPSSISASAKPLTIGGSSSSYGFYNGSVALVRIYDRELTQDEIEINYYHNFEDVCTYTKGANPFSGLYATSVNLGDKRLVGIDDTTWYVSKGNSLETTVDQGQTWSVLYTDPENSSIQQFHKFDSGRILVTNYIGKIYVSDTAGSNFQLTYTLQNAPISRSASCFGITFNGSRVWLGDYTNTAYGSGRYIYQSNDEGQTWDIVFDAGIKSNFHIHDVKYDPYENILWAVTGDGTGNHGIYYTDASVINWHTTGGKLLPQFTQIIPMPNNVLFVTDSPSNVRIYRFDRPQAGTTSVGNHTEPRLIYTIAKTWSHSQAAFGTTAAIKYDSKDPYAVFGCVQINNHQEMPIQLFATPDGYAIYKIYDTDKLPTNLPWASNIGVLNTFATDDAIYASVADASYSFVYME